MDGSDLPTNTRRVLLRWALLLTTLLASAIVGAWFLQSTIPRYVVLASGPKDGMENAYAQRYKEILARDGVTVEVRSTGGAVDNERLMLDPASGVDVAFMMSGVIRPEDRVNLVMLAGLYYDPLWIFYRGPEAITYLGDLKYRRVAIGSPGSGVRAFTERLRAANGITSYNTELVPLDNLAALRALQSGQVDVALLAGDVHAPAVWQALHDSDLELTSMDQADAYQRVFTNIYKLTLPHGSIDFARHIPARDVKLIGGKEMLIAHDGFSPAITELLLDAAREIHGDQGYFEADGEFPNTDAVGPRVSPDAIQHLRFGPSLLHRYLPFTVATYVERLIILLVPLLVVLVPVFNFLPRILSWRVHSRVYRLYGELTLLERDVGRRTGALPIEQWLAALDRIEQAAARIRTPASFASEAYTLREHIGLVRRAVMAKAQGIKPTLATSE